MLNKKQNIVIISALITGVLIVLLRHFSFPDLKIESNWGNFIFVNTILVATNLIAGAPGLLLLKSQNIARPLSITVCGVVVGYILGIILAIIVLPFATWAWNLTTILALIISYLAANAAFNKTKN